MKTQILAIFALLIVTTTSSFAQSNEVENVLLKTPLACDKKIAPEILSAYLKSINVSQPTTEAALESGGQKLNAKLTALTGDDVSNKTNTDIKKVQELVMIAQCYNILWGQGELIPEFKSQKNKRVKIITDNEEYLSMGYPSLEDATTDDEKHHAKVRLLVTTNIDAIAFVQAFFDGSKYLEKK